MNTNETNPAAAVKYVIIFGNCCELAHGPYWLRGTVWTSQRDRASEFATCEAAAQAFAVAKKVMKPAAYKGAHIVTA